MHHRHLPTCCFCCCSYKLKHCQNLHQIYHTTTSITFHVTHLAPPTLCRLAAMWLCWPSPAVQSTDACRPGRTWLPWLSGG